MDDPIAVFTKIKNQKYVSDQQHQWLEKEENIGFGLAGKY